MNSCGKVFNYELNTMQHNKSNNVKKKKNVKNEGRPCSHIKKRVF